MKVLIWIGGYLLMTLVYVLTYGILANAGAFALWLEAIAYLVIWIIVSKTLCKKWDKHKTTKKLNEIALKAKEAGMTLKEFILKDVPEKCLELCEFYKGKPLELEPYLKACVKDGKITNDAYIVLLEVYSK